MSAAYTAGSWTSLGTAVAVAAAALAGLLFIAVSINLKQSLEITGLPSRAAQTLILFATPLIGALLVVVPGQGRAGPGAARDRTGHSAASRYGSTCTRNAGPRTRCWCRLIGRVFPEVLTCTCLVLAGATLIAAVGGGLYWLVPAALAALIFGLVNVWVRLVEIMR
ncbi:MAG: hypothetical protein ACRDOK_13215 [Streptosporangiaceae bacterium]